MENIGLKLDKIKQPKPNVNNIEGEKKVFQRPYVGIISDINPTSTPLSDTLMLKGKEVPKSKHNLFKNKSYTVNIDNILSGGICFCGFLALLSLLKKIKP